MPRLKQRISMAMLGAIVVTIGGCGTADEGVVSVADEQGDLVSIDVMTPLGKGLTAATDDWLIGVIDEPFRSDEPSTIAALDLRSDEIKTFPGPVDDGAPVALSAVLGVEDGFIGIGDRCVPPDGGEGCQGSRVLVHLDPVTQDWQVEEVPLEAVGQFDAAYIVDQDLVVVESDRNQLRVSRQTSNGEWTTVAEQPSTSRPFSCVAEQALWLFVRSSTGDSDSITSTDTQYSLTRVDLSTAESVEVDLPELAGYFGGVTTSFGCDGSGPILASTPPGAVPPPNADREEMNQALTGTTIWERSDGRWKPVEVDALLGATVTDYIVSGKRPVILAAELDPDGANRPIAVVLGGEHATEVARNGSDTYLWRGSTGQLIRIFDHETARRVAIIEVGT